jgi:DNA topoisomerase-3
MRLVIAEKPSVAQSIAAVLGASSRKDGYMEGPDDLVSWCVGHLVELAPADAYDERFGKWRFEDLPILPDPWKYQVPRDRQKQFRILKSLMAQARVTEIVCATDAGREGELIFRLVYSQAGCQKPVKRLWISSMEDQAIIDGFKKLKSSQDYDLLYQSALCRAQADWLVGINATRLFSVLYRQTLNVGRVMSPTLSMVVDRWSAIQDFKSEPFYTMILELPGFEAASEKLKIKTDAENLMNQCQGKTVTVKEIRTQEKTENPPKLYDLTTLQREANRLLGFTAQQTLDYAQSLYEKKLITYPRTDSRYLTSDMAESTAVVLQAAVSLLPEEVIKDYPTHLKLLMDDAKVSDHHAIIPTIGLRNAQLEALPKGDQELLKLLAVRLITASGDAHLFAETTITLDCSGHSFTAKGKTILHSGWKAVEEYYVSTLSTRKADKKPETPLPILEKNQTFDQVKIRLDEGKTSPPKPFTEDTLLSAMENAGLENLPEDVERKGLGTPATRAGILEKLIKTELVERQGDKKLKILQPTHKGIALATILPEQIKSPQMTATWEEKLKRIEKGQLSPAVFMTEISQHMQDLVRTYQDVFETPVELVLNPESIGTCPRCQYPVLEGDRQFFCQNKDCGFTLWKDNRFFTDKKKNLTREIAAILLKDGSIQMKNLYSPKTRKTYDARIIMDDNGGKYVHFLLEFAPDEANRNNDDHSGKSKERMENL